MITLPRNKIESEDLIRSSGANYLTYEVIHSTKAMFAKLYSYIPVVEPLLFSARSLVSKGNGYFIINREFHQFLNLSIILKPEFYPCQLYVNDGKHDSSKFYQGEFLLRSDGTMDVWYNDVDALKMRPALRTPNAKHLVNVPWDVMSNKFKVAIEYICKYRWLNVIVELSYHEHKVGINKENILIWEVRYSY